ncbi:cytidine deaminase [Halomonas sp. 1513]|nr:cytidine deaminase [Halomonas sp. 1513]APX92293.1 cytidine deaminase [Halomonas sp. 1513]
MSEVSRDIVERLREIQGHAYVPYSRHPVAALVESDDGSQFLGCNVEIANYKGLCAEASAIAAMVGSGRQQIRQVYVMGPGEHLCTPCGDCRQRIREFAGRDTRIDVLDANGRHLKSYSMDELLPDSFGPENIGKPSPMSSG